MNRITVFASFDKEGIIHDYVISYLKYLNKVSDRIIFISDNEVNETEKQKLDGLVSYAECSKHGEYDFLGPTSCNSNCYHLQSYFLVFKHKVFMNKNFINWFNAVKKEKTVGDVIANYELKLTGFLEDLGFKSESIVKPINKKKTTTLTLKLLDRKVVFIKRKAFTEFEYLKQYSIWKILFYLKKHHKGAYKNIVSYYRVMDCRWFPFLSSGECKRILRFLYHKKITNSGKLIIKVCKIPIVVKKTNNSKCRR